MFANYKVFDSHCHIYPEKISRRAVDGIDAFYGVIAHGKGTVNDLIERGVSAGVDRFLVHSVATNEHQVRVINEFIAAEVAGHPDRLTGFGT
ncbi:MAG: amidohydrolase, partial [Clostridia bacterium]|nr:amidohydrolase [Clostridia bacterium]